jgi:hypothetical protein
VKKTIPTLLLFSYVLQILEKYKTIGKILSKYEKELPITVDQMPRTENQRRRSRDVGGKNEQQLGSSSLTLTSRRRHRYLAFSCFDNGEHSTKTEVKNCDFMFDKLCLKLDDSNSA